MKLEFPRVLELTWLIPSQVSGVARTLTDSARAYPRHPGVGDRKLSWETISKLLVIGVDISKVNPTVMFPAIWDARVATQAVVGLVVTTPGAVEALVVTTAIIPFSEPG